MNRRIRLAALWVATCLTTPGLAADLHRKAPPVAYADWSGAYVGLEAGHGWGNYKFDSLTSFGGVGGAGDIANTFGGHSSVLSSGFAGPSVGPFDKGDQRGRLTGGFAGAQKQRGNLVLGVEADVNAANIHRSVQSTGVSNENLSSFTTDFAPVNSLTNAGQFRTGSGSVSGARR